jgi:RNA 3'-terminal phosphate cyclase (ATP)
MPVDPHSADQLLLPLAIADGDSEYHVSEVTRHLTTNAAVVKMFLDREIAIDGDEGIPGVVRVSGRKL